MLSRVSLLACLLVSVSLNLPAVEDVIFTSGFEQESILSPPSGLSASASSSASIDLGWTDNSSTESGFTIEHSLDGSNWSVEADMGANVAEYADTGLTPATTHHYRVRAFNAQTQSAWSNTSSATTDEDVTPPPVDYVAFADQFGAGEVFGTFADTQVDDGTFQQFTEKVSGGSPRVETTFMGHFWRFNIDYGDEITVYANAWQSESSDNDSFVFAWSDDDLTYTDLFTLSSLSALNMESGSIPDSVNGPVWIRVIDTDRTAGNNRSRDSLFVDHLFIRVARNGPPTEPDAPSGLAAVSGGKTSISLSWLDNSNDETGFRLDRSTDGSSWSFLTNLGAGVEAYNNIGLTPDTTYFYRVRAFNAVGPSPYSNTASATTDEDPPPDPPAAPTGLTAIAASSDTVNLSWEDNADNETGFFIQRGTTSTNLVTVASVGVNTVAIPNTGLNGNTEYFYRVYAWNGDGDSAMSNIASATTLP